jgi:hypothetical protein
VTTGIAIDASLLPVINEVEETLRKQLTDQYSLQGVRCRIREGEVAIQLESAADIGFASDQFDESAAVVRELFVQAGFPDQVQAVLFEPYEKGSAFLIETLDVS